MSSFSQINIDYALSEAIKLSNTDNIKRVIFAYDINCQYSKRALDRLRDGEFLEQHLGHMNSRAMFAEHGGFIRERVEEFH